MFAIFSDWGKFESETKESENSTKKKSSEETVVAMIGIFRQNS